MAGHEGPVADTHLLGGVIIYNGFLFRLINRLFGDGVRDFHFDSMGRGERAQG